MRARGFKGHATSRWGLVRGNEFPGSRWRIEAASARCGTDQQGSGPEALAGSRSSRPRLFFNYFISKTVINRPPKGHILKSASFWPSLKRPSSLTTHRLEGPRALGSSFAVLCPRLRFFWSENFSFWYLPILVRINHQGSPCYFC